jgi:Leucine-rich repeat (LRR) protein
MKPIGITTNGIYFFYYPVPKTFDGYHKYIYCSNKKLASIVDIYQNTPNTLIYLQVLHCDDNKLTSIPASLISLRQLHCDNNELTSIPASLTSLEILLCHNNKLTSIPETLVKLKQLNCRNNKLTSIPASLTNLKELFCNDNDILVIPDTLVELRQLNCSNNSNLKIPILRNLIFFDFRGCMEFEKNGIHNYFHYIQMIKMYDKIMPFLIGIKKKKIRLNNDIIYKLKTTHV